MKHKTSQQIRVGIFVFMGLILSMLVIFLLGDGAGLFERQYRLFSRFKDISGLRLDAPVYLAGIQVGMVKDIQLPTDIEDRQVVVMLEIKRRFQERIRKDSEATITTQGLLGDKAVFITVGSPAEDKLKNDEEISAKQGLSMDSFAEKGGELIDNVNNLAKNANQLIADAREKEGFLHSLIYDESGKNLIPDITHLAHDAQRIVNQVQSGRGVLHALIYDPVNRDLGYTVSEAAKHFHNLSRDLEQVGVKINKGEGSIGGLINDPTVYYDLMTLLGKANRNKLLRTVIRATLATNEKDLEK